MLSTGMNASSATTSTPASDSIFRVSHPASFRAPLQPATPSSASANTTATSDPATASHRTTSSSSSVSSASASSSHHAPASLATHSSAPFIPSAAMTSHAETPRRLPDRQRSSSFNRSGHSQQQQQQQHAREGQQQQELPQNRQRQSPQKPQQDGGDRGNQPYVQDQVPQSPSSPQLQPTYRSARSLGGSEATSPSRIKVRDLSHIQSFASEDFLASSGRAPGQKFQDAGRQYEISSMPVADIIEMVAGLLTKITTTNDLQHEHLHRHIPPPEGAGNLSPQTTSVLAFHGKNVPAITILSYLSRIHKYCPTTYEVFLSMLVYFDRMTEMVNKGLVKSLQRQQSAERKQQQQQQRKTTSSTSSPNSAASTTSMSTPRGHSSQSSIITPPSSGCVDGRSHDPALPSPSSPSSSSESSGTVQPANGSSPSPSNGLSEEAFLDPANFSQYFVVDSYNIHRLVIAGVTCASKFFSDVFYTNSRYAKVGGLPLLELNHLELQFLILNDFRLSVPVEELEAYGTMLVEFYAREVVAQQRQREEEEQARSPTTWSRDTGGGGGGSETDAVMH